MKERVRNEKDLSDFFLSISVCMMMTNSVYAEEITTSKSVELQEIEVETIEEEVTEDEVTEVDTEIEETEEDFDCYDSANL